MNLEYSMPVAMYKTIAAEAPKNVNVKDWVIQFINEQFGLFGTVTVLHIEG